ncbi:UNC93-like protein MFSD11 [Sitophilus oryzae]|uniref:UNC93-like protein MFSD11 n=1 Tax=Sitophilus oryzae TaxID=7048 RepID=A0A6J2XJP6_SITOR|nr:UNC93-like protein MFSD11 [Sitophilus oryzae]XP_030750880.1 UNC93-like protein MFSD11 [Sitophilus oryzae]
MACDKGFINVLMLGLAFMLVFTAFQTWGNIQKAMIDSIKSDDPNFNGNAYISLAIVYVFFALFNWTAPSVISLIGPKFAMLIGGITYLLFIASFSIPRTWLLYLVSCIIGIGAALIWTGQGNYLALNSRPATISKNSGIFWALLQLSMFIGNTFVYFAFRDKDTIDAGTRQIVVWTLAAIALGGLAVIIFFPKPPEKDASDNNPAEEVKEPSGPIEALKGAVRLSMTKNMLLLCVTFLYTGLELGFWSGVYSSAIGSTTNMPRSKELIGVSGIFIGLGEVLGGAAFGILGNRTIRWGRDPIVIAGFVIHVASFFIIFLNLPIDAPFGATTTSAFITSNAYLAILCSFLLGLGDACYNTQIYSVLGGVYASDSAAAFAIFKFTQSVAAAISFAYASYLNLYGQLGILLVSSILGTITFVWVEWRGRRAAVDSASTS